MTIAYQPPGRVPKESSNILGLSSHLLVASTPTISTSLSPSMLANIMHKSINRYGCIKPVTSYNLGSDRNSSKKDCLLAGSLACLLAGWLAGLLACSLGPFFACLLAGRLACLLAALPPWHPSLRELSREKKSPGMGKKIQVNIGYRMSDGFASNVLESFWKLFALAKELEFKLFSLVSSQITIAVSVLLSTLASLQTVFFLTNNQQFEPYLNHHVCNRSRNGI